MNILFTEISSGKSNISYILSTDDKKEIGTAEGYIAKEDLIFVIHINEKYQNKGNGHKAFRKVYYELIKQNKNSNNVGSWHKDEEFSYCQDGMSTNLRIFKENISNGMSESQSAFNTPTGKWVQKLGFTKCTVISNTNTDVKVVFSK